MLGHTQDDFDLAMDTLTDADDPAIAIGAARLHLDAIREPAVEVYQRFDAAHQEIAHVSSTDRVIPDAEHRVSAGPSPGAPSGAPQRWR